MTILSVKVAKQEHETAFMKIREQPKSAKGKQEQQQLFPRRQQTSHVSGNDENNSPFSTPKARVNKPIPRLRDESSFVKPFDIRVTNSSSPQLYTGFGTVWKRKTLEEAESCKKARINVSDPGTMIISPHSTEHLQRQTKKKSPSQVTNRNRQVVQFECVNATNAPDSSRPHSSRYDKSDSNPNYLLNYVAKTSQFSTRSPSSRVVLKNIEHTEEVMFSEDLEETVNSESVLGGSEEYEGDDSFHPEHEEPVEDDSVTSLEDVGKLLVSKLPQDYCGSDVEAAVSSLPPIKHCMSEIIEHCLSSQHEDIRKIWWYLLGSAVKISKTEDIAQMAINQCVVALNNKESVLTSTQLKYPFGECTIGAEWKDEKTVPSVHFKEGVLVYELLIKLQTNLRGNFTGGRTPTSRSCWNYAIGGLLCALLKDKQSLASLGFKSAANCINVSIPGDWKLITQLADFLVKLIGKWYADDRAEYQTTMLLTIKNALRETRRTLSKESAQKGKVPHREVSFYDSLCT